MKTIVAELIGEIAFVVGVCMMLWHVSLLALAVAFVSGIILLAVFWNEPERSSAKSNSRQHKKQ